MKLLPEYTMPCPDVIGRKRFMSMMRYHAVWPKIFDPAVGGGGKVRLELNVPGW